MWVKHLEMLIGGNVTDIVHVALTILRLRLVRCKAPLLIYDEFVLMHSSWQLLDDCEVVPGADHWYLLPPTIEGSSQEDVLSTMRPGENY